MYLLAIINVAAAKIIKNPLATMRAAAKTVKSVQRRVKKVEMLSNLCQNE